MIKNKKKENILLRLLKDTKPISGLLAVSAFISLLSVLLALIGPDILGNLTDEIYNFWANGTAINGKEFLLECLKLSGIYLLSCLCGLATMFIMNNTVSKHFTCTLRIRMSDKIQRLSIGYLDKTPNGEIIARMMTDVSIMGNTVHNILDTVISGIIKLVCITVIIFSIEPKMAVAVVVIIPLSLILSALIAHKSEKHFNDSRKINGKIYALTEEDFTCFDTVKAFNLENRQKHEQAKLADNYEKICRKAYFLSNIVEPIIMLSNNLAYILICLLGGYLAIKTGFSVGNVVKFILYAKLLSGPLESIANGMSMMQNTFASARRVYEFLDLPEMPEDGKGKLEKLSGNVKMENVCFSYVPDKPLIKNLSIDVKAGQKVAIVGPTGGGKTTIVNLLMRFYDIDSGKIFIDGKDIYEIPKSDLRAMFGMVLQDTWLFSGTIYDNVSYGNQNATSQQVKEACERAHISDFIESLPLGYNTIINEESANISSGQKQLLTIARAYLSDRKLLILDEATSNVDTRTEILIQQTMDDLMKGKTSFIIAHRLSTIVNSDIILVINNGEIVEKGKHSELLRNKGFYAEIYNSQYELLK